ncbi:MAG: hypothetical protein ACREOJ_07425 [Gemmatimonadaceae bacterium]
MNSVEEAITTLDQMIKPVACFAIPLWGITAIGAWPAFDAAGAVSAAQDVIRRLLTSEIERRKLPPDAPVLMHCRDKPGDGFLLVERTAIEEWLSEYQIIGLECSLTEAHPSTLSHQVGMSVQLAPATAVLLSNRLWSRRFG